MTDASRDLELVWNAAMAGLYDTDLTPQQRAVLNLTRPVGLMEDTALLAAPNEFTQNILETKLRPLITQALSQHLGREIRVAVTIDSTSGPAGDLGDSGALPDVGSGESPAGPHLNGHGTSHASGNGHGRWPGPGSGHGTTAGDATLAGADQRGGRDLGYPDAADRYAGPRHPEARPAEPRFPEPSHYPEPTYPEVGDSDRGYDVRPNDPRRAEARYADEPGPTPDPGYGQPEDIPRPVPPYDGANGDPSPYGPSDPDRRHLSIVGGTPPTPARLNPKYTFDNFIIGHSNRLAHAAASAVAEAPAKAYNPLFIYGDSGLGKTHLLHAIGHYAYQMFPNIRIRYASTEVFTNDFINLVHSGKAEQFRRRYRDVDILLIDDIQFLMGKEGTQQEFFHTFETLHNANKQIVITSDRPPKQLSTLEERLRTRFAWGLMPDVQAPDLETRIAILRKKSAQEDLHAAPEVLEFIATKIQSNIRELEGALIRVSAFASLNQQGVDLSLAAVVLKDLIPDAGTSQISAATIMGVTADYFSISVDDLCGPNRGRPLVNARQISMYLCRELTDLSLPRIGQIFGGKDHTTVMHAVKKITELMAQNRNTFDQVSELTSRIKVRARGQ